MNAVAPLKLMIVDDSNIIRRRIERSQQIDRLRVVGAAANGREALDLFKRTDPDVVTMDLTMPEMPMTPVYSCTLGGPSVIR